MEFENELYCAISTVSVISTQKYIRTKSLLALTLPAWDDCPKRKLVPMAGLVDVDRRRRTGTSEQEVMPHASSQEFDLDMCHRRDDAASSSRLSARTCDSSETEDRTGVERRRRTWRRAALGTVTSIGILGLCFHPQGVASLQCYTTSFDVKNWEPCSTMLYGKALWMDRCILDELPVCEDYVQSLGCPPEGILPCQFDSSLPQSLNGNSHCYSAQEWNVCNRELEDCHKIVTSNYIRGQLEYWNVFQGCGPCPFSESVVSTCRAENCLGVEAGEGVSGVCASECFWKSEMRLQVATCYQCGSELCNLSSRRLAHAASSLLGLALFTVLLLRKCRA